MNHLLTLLVCLGGFASISLSMHRHQEDVLGRLLPANQSLILRLVGWSLLVLGFTIAGRAFGWSIGSVAWIGHLAAAAGIVIVALTIHGRRVAR